MLAMHIVDSCDCGVWVCCVPTCRPASLDNNNAAFRTRHERTVGCSVVPAVLQRMLDAPERSGSRGLGMSV
jgi:hypothetical protein